MSPWPISPLVPVMSMPGLRIMSFGSWLHPPGNYHRIHGDDSRVGMSIFPATLTYLTDSDRRAAAALLAVWMVLMSMAEYNSIRDVGTNLDFPLERGQDITY